MYEFSENKFKKKSLKNVILRPDSVMALGCPLVTRPKAELASQTRSLPRIGTETDRAQGPESAIWERAYQPMYRVFDKEIQQEHSENSEFPCM